MPSNDGPSYIAPHSADVILSDIRPIKLKIEALRCVNVLLDEFLYSIISAASSLATDKLRAGLLSVLPTTLGKEALLEAEVELRAYWDRNKGSRNTMDDDKGTFNLQWAFELLKLKCEAYSTLNDSDEDPSAEQKLHEKMSYTGSAPPKPSLVAPAALYLTAILESVCEHILSNVGRVASRDSSRTTATVQDLFVALCEDDSIYGLFKTMNVYGQIEDMSKMPKPRRSKSFSRSDKLSMSRTSSPHQDLSSSKDSPTPPPPAPSRLSSEVSTVAPPVSSRSSLDKAKSMKKLMSGSRSSHDRDVDSSHKRSGSVISEETKQTWASYAQGSYEDTSLQDFDDLMRSGSTMKVSLTPDRLKTMEVYKQEKDQRGNRRPSPLLSQEPDSSSSVPPSRRRPSLQHVDSIVEDEEDTHTRRSTSSNKRNRQPSLTSSPPPPPISASSRTRSLSATSQSSKTTRNTSSKSVLGAPPTSYPSSPSHTPAMQNKDWRSGPGSGPKGFGGADTFPPKTRKIQKNRESMDLDDVMAGSDDDGDEIDNTATKTLNNSVSSPSRMPATPKRGSGGVSANTRDLMNFLNDGPPNTPKVSKAGRELMDFLAEGPPDFSPSAASSQFNESGKQKGSGRLQRMLSKMSIGGEKGRGSHTQDDFGTSRSRANTLSNKPSNSSLPPLANKPIPPRPPIMSPPSSPSSDEHVYTGATARSHQTSMTQKNMPSLDQSASEAPLTASPPLPVASNKSQAQENGRIRTLSSRPSSRPSSGGRTAVVIDGEVSLSSNGPRSPQDPVSPRKASKIPPSTIETTRKTPTPPAQQGSPAPTEKAPTTPQSTLNENTAQDLRRLISKAASADECRLLLDIFLAKAGVPFDSAPNYDVPYPSPSPSDTPVEQPWPSDVALEKSLVEFLLSGTIEVDEEIEKEQKKPKKAAKKVVKVETKVVPMDSKSLNGAVPEDPTSKHLMAAPEVQAQA